jgi:hypothetical protein
LSTSYNVTNNITLFADWTNILPHPFHSDIVRNNYNVGGGSLTSTEVFPLVTRFEETVLSGGVRFNFGRDKRAAPPPMYVPPPAPMPAPVVEPAPIAPPAPPPPAPVERGERGN